MYVVPLVRPVMVPVLLVTADDPENITLVVAEVSTVKRATIDTAVLPATVFSCEHTHVDVSQSQSHECPCIRTSTETLLEVAVKVADEVQV